MRKFTQRIMREAYVKTLENRGIDFKTRRVYWKSRQEQLTMIANKIRNPFIVYPSYFTDAIHGYERGHLCMDQAYESTCHMEASALMSLADILTQRIHFKHDGDDGDGDKGISNEKSKKSIDDYDPSEAYDLYKAHIVQCIYESLGDDKKNIKHLTDFGCGVGELTTLIAHELSSDSTVIGVDLSPNYLSQAIYMSSLYGNVMYVHDNIETVELGCLQDVITVCYAFHEMPVRAIENTLQNAYRWLRRDGGRLIVVDMNPEKLPKYPAFIDLSEPHLREYRTVSIAQLLMEIGFQDINERYLHGTSYLFTGSRLD